MGLSPRVRGTARREQNSANQRGLSPRVRGNLHPNIDLGFAKRSIPACAGEPPSRSPAACPARGLSPRVRGNLQPALSHLVQPRVYPPRVRGTFKSLRFPSLVGGLSPRVRGNLLQHGGGATNGGSIPACAGNRAYHSEAFAVNGSIPACAGEPAARSTWHPHLGVYPRVCGGTYWSNDMGRNGSGLSPRVRGNPKAAALLALRPRSIPACAGEPAPPGTSVRPLRVYPRVCGGTIVTTGLRDEQKGLSPRVRGTSFSLSGLFSLRGLSPRVRGNHSGERLGCVAGRSIPACAGEPSSHTRFRYQKTVYPRVCGGTGALPPIRLPLEGLSPRVRGNPPLRISDGDGNGSIPACAGEPPTPFPGCP